MGDAVKAFVDGAISSRPRSNTLQSNQRRETVRTPDLVHLDSLYLHRNDAIAQYEELRAILSSLEVLQKDCVKRVRHLEGSIIGIQHRLPVDGVKFNGGDMLLNDEGKQAIDFADAALPKDLETQVMDFHACLQLNLQTVNTALKDLLRRRLKQEYVECQTESTSITAQEVGSQTLDSDEITEDFQTEKILYSLPDLEASIRDLRISCECQTDLKMDHFMAHGVDDRLISINRDNVMVIYRNPNLFSFLKPYVKGMGGAMLGIFLVYKVVKIGILWVKRA